MRITTIILLCLSAFHASAQFTLSGRVTDALTGNPLSGANLMLAPDGRGTSADTQGFFEVQNIRSSEGTFTVSFVGYETLTGKYLLKPGLNTLELKLRSASRRLDPLEVTALRAGMNDPFTQSTLTAEDIRKQNFGKDIPVLLDQTASTVTFSDAGNGVGYTGLRIRGADITRINVTLDGIPVNDPESQAVFWVNTPDLASSAEDIQIQRGVGASTLGAGNFGASVNISTSRYRPKAYVDLSTSYGSFNTLKTTLNAGSGLLGGKFTFDARASRIVSDGYIDRASSRLQSFFVSGAYWGKKTTIRLNAFTGKEKTYQSWNGLPEFMLDSARNFNSAGTEKPGEPYDNETDNYRQDYYRAFLTHAFTSRLTLNGALFLTRGKGFYENYKADQAVSRYGLASVIIGGDTLTESDVVRQLWLDNYFYGSTLALRYEGRKIQLTAGGAYTAYDARHYGRITWAEVGLPVPVHTFYHHSAFKNDANLYAKINGELRPGLFLYADLQYRYVRYKLNGFRNNPDIVRNETFHFFNPKVGISWLPGKYDRLYFSAAVANKEPNRDDFEVAGAAPVHETLYNAELGYTRNRGRFSLEAVGFLMYYRNQLILTGRINDVGAYTRTNVPESYRTGLELQGSVKFLKIVTFSANVALSMNKITRFTEYVDNYDTYQQETIPHKNTDIAFSPRLVAGGTLSVNPVKGLYLEGIAKYVGRQFMDNTQNRSRSLNPFALVDFRARYEFSVWKFSTLGLFMNLYNIGNTRYVPNGYTFSYIYGGENITENFYYPQARFHWSGGVQISF
jgi:iron complex outermembrane receptor protein